MCRLVDRAAVTLIGLMRRMMTMRLVVQRTRCGGRSGRGGERGDRQNEAEKGEQMSARGGHGIGSESSRRYRDRFA